MKITTLVIKLTIIINVTLITFTIAQPTNIRCCHGSTIANNRLYIGGGTIGPEDNETVYTDDFFSLDLTVQFNTSSPFNMPYKVHPNIIVKSDANTLVYAIDNEGGSIYFFGGFRNPQNSEGNGIYRYSLKYDGWAEAIPANGIKMPTRSTTKIVGVTDRNNNTIYIFDNSIMYIYNATEKFLHISPNLAPYQIYYYATAMLKTGVIAYIGGGKAPNKLYNIPMNEILTYDTYLSKWDIKYASGIIPEPRQGHSASIAPDGRIFMYGGYDGDENAKESNGSYPSFAVLEFTNDKFVWSTPDLIGRNKTQHRVNTIDLIDISNKSAYKFVTNFIPPASVLGSVGGLIVIGFTFFLIRRCRYRNVIPTPSG
ncbi:16686_t:CDS:2 [Rhizophagus irregularis]|nr:16686_t:CDS:2 [Rhizophagus irregularis]